MTPHLHPRSRMTSSLFATTLAASFLVVGLPHILPCPAPRVSYADSACAYEVSPDGTRQRRVRRRRPRPQPQSSQEAQDGAGIVQFDSSSSNNTSGSEEEDAGRLSSDSSTPGRRERECPVPKPGGVIGQLMGFSASSSKGGNGDGGDHDSGDLKKNRNNKLVAAVVTPRPDGGRVDIQGRLGDEK
ncbi:hypothetical protein F4775DRAFT_564640 [Biscogniauxia sp. FL1348]|nr:hypothetical protein F4775DRAFT_564640 [Biscogniauxia sp. FL1348]